MNLSRIKINRISDDDKFFYDMIKKMKAMEVSYGYTFIVGNRVIFDYTAQNKILYFNQYLFNDINRVLIHRVFVDMYKLEINAIYKSV